MLNHNLKHHLLPSALLVAGFLTLTGCTNNDYDLNNVDATMGFGSESLVIPNSSTKDIQLKDVLDLKEGGCGVPTHNGSKVTVTDISTARPLELSLKTQKLDFTNQNDHGRLSINNGAIDLTGYFSIAMQCNVTGAMPDNPTIKAKIGVADRTITMNSATGIFDPKINLNSLGEVDVTGLPDFLDDDDVVADLDNPQILLTVNNDMDVAATVSATVISTKEGRELARVTLPEMSVAKNGLSKICICRQKTSELTQQYGEANVYAVSNLSTLINRIPDHIKIVDVNAHAKPEVATIVFGEKYQVKPSYEVNAPLAFGEKANIVYEDSFTGWNDDIDELDLAEGTYIEVTANVENKVPAYLTVKAYPVDAQGNKIEDKLLIEIPDEVAASTDGTTAVTTPITMKITPKVKNSLKQLDGLVFRLEGSAKSANGNKVTGISLNEREHTLKLNDIKVKIVGKIIGDFN